MAGVNFVISAGEIALVADTAKTVLEVTAAANHRALLNEVSFMFDGTAVGNEPVFIEEIAITTTGTGTAGTVQKRGDFGETIQTSFKYNMSAEPTGITVLKRYNIHPQAGAIIPLPITRPIPIPGGDLWGLRMTAPDNVNVVVNAEGEE